MVSWAGKDLVGEVVVVSRVHWGQLDDCSKGRLYEEVKESQKLANCETCWMMISSGDFSPITSTALTICETTADMFAALSGSHSES